MIYYKRPLQSGVRHKTFVQTGTKMPRKTIQGKASNVKMKGAETVWAGVNRAIAHG